MLNINLLTLNTNFLSYKWLLCTAVIYYSITNTVNYSSLEWIKPSWKSFWKRYKSGNTKLLIGISTISVKPLYCYVPHIIC